MNFIKELILILFVFFTCLSNAQSSQNFLQVTTGFNRVGFFNEAGFKFEIKHHQFKFGLRHYTLDNFFEKNTIGFSFDYNYQFTSRNNKFFFYPGVSTAFFMENKTNTQVFNSDYKLVNGVGINLNPKWSVFYQLGFGVITTKSYLINSSDVVQISFFNYELAVGLSYRFIKGEKRYLEE